MCHANAQKYRPRPSQLIVVSLGGFRPFPTIEVTSYWIHVWWWIHVYPLLRIGVKCHLDYAELSLNCALNHLRIALSDVMLGNTHLSWCSTHLAQTFFICKFSSKVFITHSVCLYIYDVNYLPRFYFVAIQNNTVDIFLMISGVDACIGRQKHGATFVLIRPNLKSQNHEANQVTAY